MLGLLDYGDPGGAPPLLLLHGIRDLAWSMDPIAQALRDRYRVLSLDLRGHGASEHPGAYTFPLYAADLHCVLDRLGDRARDPGRAQPRRPDRVRLRGPLSRARARAGDDRRAGAAARAGRRRGRGAARARTLGRRDAGAARAPAAPTRRPRRGLRAGARQPSQPRRRARALPDRARRRRASRRRSALALGSAGAGHLDLDHADGERGALGLGAVPDAGGDRQGAPAPSGATAAACPTRRKAA